MTGAHFVYGSVVLLLTQELTISIRSLYWASPVPSRCGWLLNLQQARLEHESVKV